MPEGSSGENLSFNSEQCGSSPVEVFAKKIYFSFVKVNTFLHTTKHALVV